MRYNCRNTIIKQKLKMAKKNKHNYQILIIRKSRKKDMVRNMKDRELARGKIKKYMKIF